MKRALIVILMIALFAFSSHAQISVEFDGGINIANLSDPGNLTAGALWKSRLGFTGGISISIQLAERLLVCPGLRFVQKGTTAEGSSPFFGQFSSNVTNNYLELPLYLKFQIAHFGSRLFVIGGPAFSYLVSSRIEWTNQDYGTGSADTKDNYKSYDGSIDVGLSVQKPLNDELAIVATGIYSYGFVKISDLGSNEQTRDVRLLVGVSCSLK